MALPYVNVIDTRFCESRTCNRAVAITMQTQGYKMCCCGDRPSGNTFANKEQTSMMNVLVDAASRHSAALRAGLSKLKHVAMIKTIM